MALTDEHVEMLAQAASILNAEVAGANILPRNIRQRLSWTSIDTIIRATRVEGKLRRNIEVADQVLKDAAEAFADFHDVAADVEVKRPTAEQVASFKDKLRELHQHVQAGQRLEAASKFAGALADKIERHA